MTSNEKEGIIQAFEELFEVDTLEDFDDLAFLDAIERPDFKELMVVRMMNSVIPKKQF